MSDDNPALLGSILDLFTSQDLAEALFQASAATAGAKDERIARLLELPVAPEELLDLFTAEALRGACARLNLRSGRKAEMIAALLGPVVELLSKNQSPPAAILEPTRDNVLQCLAEVELPRRKLHSEADVEWYISEHLTPRFASVAVQYSIGGYLGTKIDLDIGNGNVGVEVKLASSLMRSTEAHRLMGQALHYDRRRYKGNLIVAIAGTASDLNEPLLAEMREILASLGISCAFIASA